MVNEAGEMEKRTHLLMPAHDSLLQTAVVKRVQIGRMGTGALEEEMHMRLHELLDFGELQKALDK